MRTRLTIATLLLVSLLAAPAGADENGTTNGLIANGAVATVLGTLAVVSGAAIFASARASWDSPGGCSGSCTDGAVIGEGAGIGLLAAGAAHLAVGVPLLAVGVHRRTTQRVQVLGAAAPSSHGAGGTLLLRF
jgi:hypothetical protein